MKKILAAIALIAVASAAPAHAGDLGVSISLGEPGFYGQIDLGNIGRPGLMNAQPVLIERRYGNLAPIYLRVPPGQQKNWRKFCDQYNACSRPVYFVRDDWYRNVYAPQYRSQHERRDGHRDEHRDDRRDERGHDKDERR
jgi:hypothetical protein